jgi:peptide/nickel transport system substrate-binding protein
MRGSWIRITGLVLAGLGAVALVAWLAWPKKSPTTSDPPPILRFSLEGRLLTFDPHLHDEGATWTTLCNVFEGLVRFDANLKIEAALARSWSNPDATHWLFELRPGVRFHDGRPLEAEDVAYSIRRAATYERSVIRPYFTSIRQVSTVDPLRVEIETKEPDPLLLNKLTFAYVVPRAASFENPALANRPVGTGPYRFDHWLTESRFLLKRFGGYWGRPAVFPQVEVSYINESSERVAALRAGEVDLTRSLRGEDVARINAKPGYRATVAGTITVMLMTLHIAQKPGAPRNPLAQQPIRQAIHLTLDRQEIVRRGFNGLARPAYQLVPPEVFGFDRQLPPGGRDVARARALLAAAGYADGFRLEVCATSLSRRVGEVIRDNLGEIGIKVALRVLPWDELYRRFRSDSPPQAAIFGWSCNSGDESDFLDTCLHSRQSGGEARMGELNTTGWSSPELDDLITRSRHVMRVQDRLAMLGRINRIALEQLPYIPLTIDTEVYGHIVGLKWQPRIDSRIYLHELEWQPAR